MGSDDRLGNYNIQGEIGRGGMAIVYKAIQSSLGRTVAVKELDISASGADPLLLERFRREARAAAALHHPNITTIHDFWESGNRAYIVMEYVDGPELKEVLAVRKMLEPSLAMLIAIEVCRALAYAHGRGMVHRDIKPGNIMLSTAGDVKLTDFGIVLVSESTELTVPGHMLGTPAYMSPEQITGQDVGPASDIFSLGTMLYEMVTGRRPFVADNPIALSHAILHSEPEQAHVARPGVPGTLSAIIMKCLAREPSARFSTMDELEETLQGVLPSLASILPEAIISLCRDLPPRPDPTPASMESAGRTVPAAQRPAAPDGGEQITAAGGDQVARMAEELGIGRGDAVVEGEDTGQDQLQMPPLPGPGESKKEALPPSVTGPPRQPPERKLSLKEATPPQEQETAAPARRPGKVLNALAAAMVLAAIAGGLFLVSKKVDTAAIKTGIEEKAATLPQKLTGAEKATGKAFILLRVSPWAEMTLDGQSRGRVEGGSTLPVESGPHTLVFKHPQLGEKKVIVDLEKDDSRSIVVVMGR